MNIHRIEKFRTCETLEYTKTIQNKAFFSSQVDNFLAAKALPLDSHPITRNPVDFHAIALFLKGRF
jgi:hypothetical protein